MHNLRRVRSREPTAAHPTTSTHRTQPPRSVVRLRPRAVELTVPATIRRLADRTSADRHSKHHRRGRPGPAWANSWPQASQSTPASCRPRQTATRCLPDTPARHSAQDLDRRALRLDASGAGLRTRRAAIPKAKTNRRAHVRPHQTQQRCHQIPQTRQGQSAHRVAVTHDDPQPDQALQPPDSQPGGLKRAPPGDNALHNGHTTDAASTTIPPAPGAGPLRNSLGYKEQPGERSKTASLRCDRECWFSIEAATDYHP